MTSSKTVTRGSWRGALIAAIVVAVLGYGVVNVRREARMHGLIEESRAYLDSAQSYSKDTFQLNLYARYDYDQRLGTLTLRDSTGRPRVAARIQIVGTFSERSRSWLWSWANPTIESTLADGARTVRNYGLQDRQWRLRDSEWRASNSDAWDMTAVTAKLLKAKGAYRSPTDSGALFMVFTEIRRLP